MPSHGRSIAICGYGPSLAETWQDVKLCDDVLTVSGAHDFLIERGIIPTYHLECDPREYKADFLTPHKGVKYLINAQCHDSMFKKLKGFDVTVWFGYCYDESDVFAVELFKNEGNYIILGGGTTSGMRAFAVAREYGYRNFEGHGLDCCYGETQWAGPHGDRQHRTVKVEVNGRTFTTSNLMMQATDDFFTIMGQMRCRFVIHGGGLLEERLKIYNKDPYKAVSKSWWKPLDFTILPSLPTPVLWGYQLSWMRDH
jgi:Uncharacterized protein conserved in bacteria